MLDGDHSFEMWEGRGRESLTKRIQGGTSAERWIHPQVEPLMRFVLIENNVGDNASGPICNIQVCLQIVHYHDLHSNRRRRINSGSSLLRLFLAFL